jgi:tRNA (adenine22-N1)-methyltransferase
MQKFKISGRLNALMEQATKLEKKLTSIADVGTDHGYLPYTMFDNHMIEKSILCDINKGPLENAIQTFEGSDYAKLATFRLGSGIEPLKMSEVDLVYIAGMGGGLIQEILAKNLEKSKSFAFYVLQPMTEQDSLRSWLIENGFNILWDHFIKDAHKHYEIIVVTTGSDDEVGKNDYDLISIVGDDLEFGKTILRSQIKDYLIFLDFKEKKYQSILSQIKKEANSDPSEKITLCHDKLETLSKIRESIKA